MFGEYNLLTGKRSEYSYTAVAKGYKTQIDLRTVRNERLAIEAGKKEDT